MKLNQLVTAFALIAGLAGSVQASLVDTWSIAGGAWTASSQSGFVSGTGGALTSDVGSTSGAALNVANAASGGLYTSFYYTLNSAPVFVLSDNDALADATTITLAVTLAGDFASAPVIAFNGAPVTRIDSAPVSAGNLMGSPAYIYSYTWDVTGLTDGTDTFSIGWTLPVHTGLTNINLTQTSAIPEPSAFAALAGLGVLGLAVTRRRRA